MSFVWPSWPLSPLMLIVIETYFPFPVAWQIVILSFFFEAADGAPAPNEPPAPTASTTRADRRKQAMRLERRKERRC